MWAAAYLHDVWTWMEEKEVSGAWRSVLLGGWAATLPFSLDIICGAVVLFAHGIGVFVLS